MSWFRERPEILDRRLSNAGPWRCADCDALGPVTVHGECDRCGSSSTFRLSGMLRLAPKLLAGACVPLVLR